MRKDERMARAAEITVKAEREKLQRDMDKALDEGRRLTRVKEDMVNTPKHYELLPGVEVHHIIKACLTEEEFIGWHKGNAIKYLLRAEKKGKPVEDRQKCKWMLEKVIPMIQDASDGS